MAVKSYALSLPPLEGGDADYSATYYGIGTLTRKGGKSSKIEMELTEAQHKSLKAKGVILKSASKVKEA